MTDANATTKPDPPTRSATMGSTSTALPPSAAARQRLPQRSATASPSPRPDPLLRRRSSLLSYSSIEDVSQSFADEIINPRMGRRRGGHDENQLTHWQSSPLAFAILPAIGGLLFKNGSAFVTDALLLGLAAIFLNWSIRLPWDWYCSAQELRRDVEPSTDAVPTDVEDETAAESASSAGSSPTPPSRRRQEGTERGKDAPTQDVAKREEAAGELRRQELLALGATFVFPALAAYLLHIIRAQLTTASTVLVSDTNLSIFLLGAEIQPFRQLIRLVSRRTLYLQRVVTGLDDPLASAVGEKHRVSTLASRIQELESKLADNTLVPQTTAMAQKTDINDLSAEIRKRYEPRVEGLERAVRRYEKRQTTIAIQIEQRLQLLESRTQDAVSLAAAAAQNSRNRGVVGNAFTTLVAIVMLPLRLALQICLWPLKALDDMYLRLKTLLLGPGPPRSAKRKSSRRDGSANRDDGRARDLRDKVPTSSSSSSSAKRIR
ncbi:Hypothetical predicted protein [Lecanosticta acicola]|uniref:Uncharacterized protein n=1 Tax=Lecanosticta acicola TaxID=111012 RepID=A0AAI8YSV8_9PEZI|nr:Hypothetical predicted protein [Lecanosticta acicola]